MALLDALTTAILPVLSVAAVGFVLGRFRAVDVEPLSTVTIYVLTPALIFHSLTTTTIGGGTVAALVVGVGVFTGAMAVVAEGAGRLAGEDEPALSALVLASIFPNAGNLGIPLSAFAFGAVGRSTAVLFIVGQSLLMYTLGIFVASRNRSESTLGAVGEVFRLPLVYAVAAAGLARWLGVVPPTGSAVMETIRLTGDASIPVMLLILGLQLSGTATDVPFREVGLPTVLKLFVAPGVGLGVAVAVGLGGDVARVFVLECAMPAAITPLMFAIEYGDPDARRSAAAYVSTAVFVTTLASIATLAVLLTVLQSGGLL